MNYYNYYRVGHKLEHFSPAATQRPKHKRVRDSTSMGNKYKTFFKG